jgi:hypothetical protein
VLILHPSTPTEEEKLSCGVAQTVTVLAAASAAALSHEKRTEERMVNEWLAIGSLK